MNPLSLYAEKVKMTALGQRLMVERHDRYGNTAIVAVAKHFFFVFCCKVFSINVNTRDVAF